MFNEIYYILSVAGVFAVLDAMAPPKSKIQIADFVFGLHEVSASQFEKSLVSIWVSIFFQDTKIKWSKVFLLSIFTTLVVVSVGNFFSKGFLYRVLENPPFLVFLILGSVPLMIVNLYISRAIYFGPTHHIHPIIQLSLDLLFCAISFLAVYLSFVLLSPYSRGLAYSLGGLEIRDITDASSISLFMSFISSMIFLLMRIIIVSTCFAIRSFVLITRANFEIATWTNAYSNPLTYLAILFLLCMNILRWIGVFISTSLF